jgi:hydrogenase-4 component E
MWIDALIVLVVLSNMNLLGSSRLYACIRIIAVQGVLMGILPLLVHAGDISLRMVLTAAASTGLKGLVFPWLLLRAARQAGVGRELEPVVGYTTSIAMGIGLLAGATWISRRLPMVSSAHNTHVVAVALFTLMVGLFLIVGRNKALLQVLGYLAMENGIYAFGLAFAQSEPLMVELGILLDVFMAVFVMGITIYHINREFDHIDTDRLSELRG